MAVVMKAEVLRGLPGGGEGRGEKKARKRRNKKEEEEEETRKRRRRGVRAGGKKKRRRREIISWEFPRTACIPLRLGLERRQAEDVENSSG